MNILRRSRDDTWELNSERLTSEVDRASATLTERRQKLNEWCKLEVHHQSIEGRDRNLKEWARGKLTHMNTQLRGLRDFATAVETFVHQKRSLRRAEPQLRNLALAKSRRNSCLQ